MNKYEKLSIEELVLWKDNARYSKALDSEEECLEELYGNKLMNQKQRILLDDIFLETNIFENCIIYKEETDEGKFQYVVLDGNRRISLFKLFNYPDLIKKFGMDMVKLDHIKEKIKQVDCKVYEDLNEAYKHVVLRHLDEQNGKGTVKWGPESKERMLLIQGKEVNSIGYKIMKFYESTNKPEFQGVKDKIKDKSTLDRIFGYKNTYSNIFGLKSKYDYDLYNYEQQIKINEILRTFYMLGGKVASVYTADLSKKLFEDVETLSKNDGQLSLDNTKQNINLEFEGSKTNHSSKTPNSYKMNEPDLFNWRNRGINSNNTLLNHYLKKLVNINRSTDIYKDLVLDIAPYFYRLLLDIAISDINKYIRDGNADKILLPIYSKQPFNTTSIGVSCVNTNKISSIINLCDNLRRNEDKKILGVYQNLLKPLHFTTKNDAHIEKFVQDLNDVVHGSSQTLSRQTLEKYDTVTIILLQLIYHFMDLK